MITSTNHEKMTQKYQISMTVSLYRHRTVGYHLVWWTGTHNSEKPATSITLGSVTFQKILMKERFSILIFHSL